MPESTVSKNTLLAGFLISFFTASEPSPFSTKAILVKLAFHHTHADAVTLLTLRMLLSLPFYLLAALWGSRREGNVRMSRQCPSGSGSSSWGYWGII